MNKRRVAINMTAQLLAFAVNMLLGFFLVPVIEAMIPNAYGFTDIANRFVSAAQIVVSALNTMASRYITVHIHRGEDEEASQYFSSVFFANVFMAVVFMVPALFVIIYLGAIFEIPEAASLPDIQMLFFFIFLNFMISIISSVFSVSTYCRDRLDLSSIATILGEVVRLTVLAVCYIFFKPYLFYVGCASVASTVIQAVANAIFTKRLLPEMKIRRKDFRMSKVKELVSLGAWNSITRLGQLLIDGLNTTVANIMISAAAMTTISIASQVPTLISNLMGTIAGVFNPQMTMAYAENDKEKLLSIIGSADRIMIFIISIPMAFLTVFGEDFFRLWVGSTQDAAQLHILAVLGIGTTFVSSSIQVLYHVLLILKKVKLNSIMVLLTGAFTLISEIIVLNTTNLGMFAIVGSSAVFGLLRNLFFTPLYSAYCLKVKWSTFYGDIVLGLIADIVLCLVCLPFRIIVNPDSWVKLLGVWVVCGVLALVINFFLVLRKPEREMVTGVIKGKIFKSGGEQ